MRRCSLAALGLAAVLTVVTGCSATPAAPAPSTTPRPPCNDASLTAVRFSDAAGASLSGYVAGTGKTGVVLANELELNACSWRPYARKLATRGYQVLAFDFNSDDPHGRVESSTDNGNVVAAADALRRRGADTIVLLGASRGGTAVLIAATKVQPPVAGVISLSGPTMVNGMNAAFAVPQLTVAVLYVVADMDDPFHGDAETLHDATPPALARLVVVEGTGHGEAFPLGSAASSYRAMMAVDDFLAAHAPVDHP